MLRGGRGRGGGEAASKAASKASASASASASAPAPQPARRLDADYPGGVCYFPRDLGVGYVGGDVRCLNDMLRAEGFSSEPASDYFSRATMKALIEWQDYVEVYPAEGWFGRKSREEYGERYGKSSAAMEKYVEEGLDRQGVRKACVEMCSTLRDSEACAEACVRSDHDVVNACEVACVQAHEAVCHKEYGTEGAFGFSAEGEADRKEKLRICLAYKRKTCQATCKSIHG